MRPYPLLASLSLLLVMTPVLRAAAPESADDKDRTIRELTERVHKLEARVAALEKQAKQPVAKSPSAAADELKATLSARAHERMRQDLKTHTPEQIGEAEALYQVANKDFDTKEARESLRKMIDKFPRLNRTGFALLYLAQMSKGDEMEKLLAEAIEGHSDCFYGDGVQVGGLARLLLAQQYLKTKRPDKAHALFEELRADYPDAIDHKGKRLVDQIPTGAKGTTRSATRPAVESE